MEKTQWRWKIAQEQMLLCCSLFFPSPRMLLGQTEFYLHTEVDWDNITPSSGIQTHTPKLPSECACPYLLMLMAINICVMLTSGGLVSAWASLYCAAQNIIVEGMGELPTVTDTSKTELGRRCWSHASEERMAMLLCPPKNLCLDAGG